MATAKAKSSTSADKGRKTNHKGVKVDGLHRPLQPSKELGAIVGNKPMARAEVVRAMWDYIKKNDLQDPQDGRNIKADDKLSKVFGKKEATMFELNKHLSGHLKSVN